MHTCRHTTTTYISVDRFWEYLSPSPGSWEAEFTGLRVPSPNENIHLVQLGPRPAWPTFTPGSGPSESHSQPNASFSSDYCCHLGLSESLWSCEIPHVICCVGRCGLTDTEYVGQGPCFPSGDRMGPGVAESATASYRHLPGASTGWRPSCIVTSTQKLHLSTLVPLILLILLEACSHVSGFSAVTGQPHWGWFAALSPAKLPFSNPIL